jgi:hypothetical protein
MSPLTDSGLSARRPHGDDSNARQGATTNESDVPREEPCSEIEYRFERYVRLHGLPTALYPDRDSIYVCTREACLEEDLAQVGPEMQFARAMRELGVELIPAYSPQSKGRVERRHGLFQDRLVKEMRLRGISSIEAANAYLEGPFLKMINERYTVKARDPANGHQPRPTAATPDLVLSWQEPRSVAKDWTIRWRNRQFQIDARHAALGLPDRRVIVVERRDGTLAMCYGKRLLTFRDAPLPILPPPRPAMLLQSSRRTPTPPAADHPWRRRQSPACRLAPRPLPTSYRAHSQRAGNQTAAPSKNTATLR